MSACMLGFVAFQPTDDVSDVATCSFKLAESLRPNDPTPQHPFHTFWKDIIADFDVVHLLCIIWMGHMFGCSIILS